MTIHVFGLTGGIGSGKSTVAARFRARRLPVIDADELAREAVARGSPALNEIAAELGAAVIDASGELDRKRVADIVFGDEAKRKELNSIVHPYVRELSVARIGELDRAGEPLVCYEVPLLVETGLYAVMRPFVVVVVSEEQQLERTRQRDAATEQEVRARMRAQLPLSAKVELADYVIDNSGALAATLERADDVLDAICRLFEIDPQRYPRPAPP